MKKTKNIAWGLFFVAAGALILLSQTGVLEGLSFWSLVISLLMVPIIIKSIGMRAFGGILFPAAIILIAFDDCLGIENLTPWPVLGCAAFLTIGLHILFPTHKNWRAHLDEHFDTHLSDDKEVLTDWSDTDGDGERVFFQNRFSGSVKYMTADPFTEVNIRSSFGGTTVYFDGAVMKNDQATVNLDAEFSGVDLYIPKAWTLINNANCSFGAVEEKGHAGCAKNGKTLVINGSVRFAGVTVYYV